MLIKLTRRAKDKNEPCLVNINQIGLIRPSNKHKIGSNIMFATDVDWEIEVLESVESIMSIYESKTQGTVQWTLDNNELNCKVNYPRNKE